MERAVYPGATNNPLADLQRFLQALQDGFEELDSSNPLFGEDYEPTTDPDAATVLLNNLYRTMDETETWPL